MAAHGFVPDDAMPRRRGNNLGPEGGEALAGVMTALTGIQTLHLG